MAPTITQDPGHGDSTSAIPLIMVGDLDGDIVRPGLVSDLAMDTDMEITVMDMEVVDGGVLHFIIPLVGVDGMEE